MNKIKYSKILIIGSGPSGCTSSIYLLRANLNPIILTGLKIGGQLIDTNEIENWPGIKNLISGVDLMNNFFIQMKNLFIELYFDQLYNLNLLFKPVILFSFNYVYLCDILIIATGAKANYLSLLNEKKYLGRNISTCSICDGNFYKKKDVVIVGGGNVALENIIYLSNLCNKIILINRSKKFNTEYILFKKFLLKKFIKNNIIIKLNTVVVDIYGDENFFKYLKVFNLINFKYNFISTDGLFLSIGTSPNTCIFLGQLVIFKNHILNYNGNFYNLTLTSINGIYSSGDVNDYLYKQAITSSAYGCISAFDSIYYYNKLFSF